MLELVVIKSCQQKEDKTRLCWSLQHYGKKFNLCVKLEHIKNKFNNKKVKLLNIQNSNECILIV